MPKKLKSFQSGFSPLIIIIIVAVVVLAGGGYYLVSKGVLNKSSKSGVDFGSVVEQVKNTPYSQLESALNKTSEAKTAYLEFNMKDSAMITFVSQGLTKTIVGVVDGYIAGSTDGKDAKMEIRISSPENPGTSINISTILLSNGDAYIKGPATNGKWLKSTTEKLESDDEKTPTDASLYGFQMLSTVFSENKAVFKSINKDSVTKLPDEEKDGKKYSKYSAEMSTPDFLTAQATDPDFTEKDKADANIILQDAVMKVTFTVDNSTNYITGLTIEAKHLTQIPTPESKELGVSTKHDLDISANLSRFNVPADVAAPDPSEVMSAI